MQSRKRTWLFFWVLAPWLLMVCLGVLAIKLYARPLPSAPVTVTDLPAATTPPVTLPWPGFGQAAIGTAQDGVLMDHGDQKPVPTASTAKIMTAMAVLQRKPLALNQPGPNVPITAADEAIYNDYNSKDGSVAAVSAGEQISEYQALQALLLPSANNFADTLVNWAFGSMANYLTYANEHAKQLGMNNTHFADASGFSPQTVSTAHDMVLLAQAAAKQPAFAQIVSQDTATIPVGGVVHNVNAMLGTNGIDGIKTGNTDQAGGAFVFSAPQKMPDGSTRKVLGAVMAAPDLYQAMVSSPPLVTATTKGFTAELANRANQTMGIVNVPWNGDRVLAVVKNEHKLLVFGDKGMKRSVTFDAVTGARRKGEKVGTYTIVSGDKKYTEPIVLAADVDAASGWYRVTHR